MDSATILFIVRLTLYVIILILFVAQKVCINELKQINDKLAKHNIILLNGIIKLMKENKDEEK